MKTHRPARAGSTHKAPTDRSEAARSRSTSRYRKFQQWFRTKYPLCVDPFGRHDQLGVKAVATTLHHVIPVHENPQLLCDPDNCRGLCNSCHMRVESMERRGESSRHLFGVTE